jgi:uncharacterized membrane protein
MRATFEKFFPWVWLASAIVTGGGNLQGMKSHAFDNRAPSVDRLVI